ncbi:uncharacterized protein V6R79_023314 [Siganus canaliculatus]
MNLNNFVVLPSNKMNSIKHNPRNLQKLQMETVTLGQESIEMEEKLQQLKKSMCKEKEERANSGRFRWKSGQCGSLNNNTQTNKKNKENGLQKLSAGNVKIRVLKDEPLAEPPTLPSPSITQQKTRQNKLRGSCCGQCEVKTAGLMCPECTEYYCIGCFARIHQKGALKLHRMVPIQAELHTHVNTRDVISCFQEEPNSHDDTFTSHSVIPDSTPTPDYSSRSNDITGRGHQSSEVHPHRAQVLVVTHEEEEQGEMTLERPNLGDESWGPTSLFEGQYDEEESAKSFQEALRQWRAQQNPAEEPMSEEAMWTPFEPVSLSAKGVQTDLTPNRGADRRPVRGPVRVEFRESSLTYMDRLLLKKHRRTPSEACHLSLTPKPDLRSLPVTNTEEDTTCSLTAQEEDFRHYCASLFAVRLSRDRIEPQITPPESCFAIEVLDERDQDVGEDFVDTRKLGSSMKPPSEERTPVPRATLKSMGSSRVSLSPRNPTQVPAQPRAAQTPHASPREHSKKSSSTEAPPPARPTGDTRMVEKRSSSKASVCKSNADNKPPQLLSSYSPSHSKINILKSSKKPCSVPSAVTSSACPRSPTQDLSSSPISCCLRSTFTVSPSSSDESNLLPKAYQATQFQKVLDSSLLPEELQLSAEPISSLNLPQMPSSHLEPSRKSLLSLCEPQSLSSECQLQTPLSHVSSSPHPLETVELCNSQNPVSHPRKLSPDLLSTVTSSPRNEDIAAFMTSTPIFSEHETIPVKLNTQCVPPLLSQLLNVTHTPSPVEMDTQDQSIDSGDEMSSDSLGLVSHEDDSSDEDTHMDTWLTRERSREGEQEIPAIHGEGDEDFHIDEKEQLSDSSVGKHKRCSGSQPERLCDLDGLPPLGLDMNSSHSDAPENTSCESQHTSLRDADPPGSVQSVPPVSGLTAERCLSCPTLGADLSPVFPRPFSRAALAIMEICSVDEVGCEDPDLDADTTANTLLELEEDLQLMAKGKQASGCVPGSSGSQDQHGNDHFTRSRICEEVWDEEAVAAETDRQSVLHLP